VDVALSKMLNPITKNERILLMVVVRISAILGILGGVYIFKQRLSQAQLFRNHMGRIMVALAISDILNAIVALLGVEYIPYSATLCTIQGH
jgi:predicted small integral membrane protein